MGKKKIFQEVKNQKKKKALIEILNYRSTFIIFLFLN